jgi:hypothetical protein
MTYDPKRTPSLVAWLEKEPWLEFTAAKLGDRTRANVPKKFVRRALTVDAEKQKGGPKVPMPGVKMVKKDGLWRFSWTGVDKQAARPPISN